MIIDVPNKGRCVISEKDYEYGEYIEECECILIPNEQKSVLKDTIINEYWFDGKSGPLLLLGNGSLYNHWHEGNVVPVLLDNGKMGMMARKSIKLGDELVFDYGYSLKEKPQAPVHIEGIMRDGKFIDLKTLFNYKK